HEGTSNLRQYKGFLSVGHDEYYSRPMFDAVAAARDAGVNLAFFGGDEIRWQVRFEGSASGAPNRVLVCYKDAALDPISDPSLETVQWQQAPLSRPAQALSGLQ